MSEIMRTYRTWKGVEVQDLVVPDLRARMALDIAKHCSMIAGTEDGEDSAGRQQIRLLTPSEVADRAVDIANFMYDRFVVLGWVHDCPELPDYEEEEVEEAPNSPT